jgi:hypothetical protein
MMPRSALPQVRVWLMWKERALRDDPSMAHASVLWRYPRRGDPVPPVATPGTALDDVMSPAMPFTDILSHDTPRGATHRDMLTHVPDYTYERMSA